MLAAGTKLGGVAGTPLVVVVLPVRGTSAVFSESFRAGLVTEDNFLLF